MKAGVVVDNHKLEIFRRNLKEAGFDWEESAFTKDVTTMAVTFEPVDIEVLTAIVKASNLQAKGKS